MFEDTFTQCLQIDFYNVFRHIFTLFRDMLTPYEHNFRRLVITITYEDIFTSSFKMFNKRSNYVSNKFT